MIHKILIDGRLVSDKPTGISRYSLELIKSYVAEYGVQNVSVLCNTANSHLFTNPIVTQYRPFNLLHFILLSFWIKKKDFTVFHATTYTGLLFKPSSLKSVVTVHDIFYRIVPEFFSANYIVNRLAILYYDLIVKKSIRSSSIIISVSDTTKEDLMNFTGRDSIVVYEGVNNFDKIEKPSKKDFFLYVGNLRKQKNVQLLVDVFSDLPDEKLIICGNPKGIKTEWLSIPNITFSGFVSDQQLANLYSECRAFIFPSLYEGFGLPVLEALAQGTIVFSSTGGALKEFKNSNIYHFSPNSKTELYKLVRRASALSFDKESAEKFLGAFSWEKILREMHTQLKAKII